MDEVKLTPSQYFEDIKGRKNHINDEQLIKVYDNCLELLSKCIITGQEKSAKKLIFHLECIEKERKIIALGIDTFIYRSDIEYYIDNVSDDAVKIIELENYEREIPDEIVDVVEKVKGEFDQLYVVFTDYTGETEKQVEKERRDKDPILFGVFMNKDSNTVVDRFYYLGDWIDEYCDLTLDKMVNETEKVGNRKISHTIKTPEDIQELKAQLNMLTESEGNYIVKEEMKKERFFKRVLTFLSGKANEKKC